MSRRPKPITPDTPQTFCDYLVTALFWGFVLGWPLFVVIWRWTH